MFNTNKVDEEMLIDNMINPSAETLLKLYAVTKKDTLRIYDDDTGDFFEVERDLFP